LEILLVVGIISLLAGIVIVAINPGKQLATVRNTQRKSDIKQINSAITQYYIANGRYPATLPTTLTEVCATGNLSTTTGSGIICGSLIDLTVLVPTYITAIPVDPQGPVTALLNKLITPLYAITGGTGYYVMKDTTNKLVLNTERAELGTVIAIGTTTGMTGEEEIPDPETYTITYNGNGNDTGSVPTDDTDYEEGDTVTVLGNTGTLAKDGYTFDGWNTASDGSGDSYAPSASFIMPSADTTLWAQWEEEVNLTYGLINHWKMNDNAANTTVVDIMSIRNGTYTPSTAEGTVTGKINSALRFNGISRRIALGTSNWLSGKNKVSFSFWIYPTLVQTGGIISQTSGAGTRSFRLYYYSGGLALEIFNSDFSNSNRTIGAMNTPLEINSWTHAVVSWDGLSNSFTYYINGEPVDFLNTNYGNIPNQIFNSDRQIYIGNMETNFFPGNLDDFRIYDRILNQSEVSALYNNNNGTEGY
jgi:uncharacterized repeat protein (TIGR02543 family)